MILEPKKIKSVTVSIVSPSICHEVMGPDAMILGDVKDLDWEDPLEEGMATQSSILSLRLTWTEEPGELQYMGSQRVRHN